MTAPDALRDAVRAYLATLSAEELAPPCRATRDCANAAVALAASKADGRDIGVCEEHARDYSAVAPLPARVTTLRALAAMVAEPAAPAPCDCSECAGTHRVVGSMGHERPCDYCACVVTP